MNRLIIALVLLASASPAYAQICKETDGGSSGSPSNKMVWIDCDHNYRDTKVTCDNNAKSGDQFNSGTRPSCPPKPMPMMSTPMKSFMTNYSPYLFAYARDEKQKAEAYNGYLVTGTGGGADKVFSMQGNVGSPDQQNKQKAGPSISNCKPQIKLPRDFNVSINESDLKNQAKAERMNFDNCTNQYILQTALYPFQDSRTRLINNPQESADYISLATECQPLEMDTSLSNDNEYIVSDYIIAAWKKLLKDPDYRFSKQRLNLTWMARAALETASLTLPDIEKNKHEPHLPDKVEIKDPIDPPTDFDKVKPSHIVATPYEKISDPSHPFSPRWDFLFNEREFYSQMTGDYQKDKKNSVYCAGVKEAKNESDTIKKANKEVPVDVVAFRERAFTEGILNRIGFNKICKKDADDNQEKDGEFFSLLFQSYCVKMNVKEMAQCALTQTNCDKTGTQKPCWKCFKLSDKVDNPPCSTRYDEKDLKVKGSLVFPGIYNGFQKKASCNPVYYFRKGKHNIDKLCNTLRKPYTQINRLKMRYDNPNDTDNNVMTAGVQEGMRFTDYFGHHMPYPRIFDVGTSLHKSKQTDTNYQQADDTTGQFTTIVGIGREGAPKSAGDDAQKKHKDERCLYGGWGGDAKTTSSTGGGTGGSTTTTLPTLTGAKEDTSFLGITINVPDPVTSWTEIKAQQMRTMRLTNLSCIGRYEKVFKPGNSESVVLKAVGGEWSNVVVQKCPRNSPDPTKCTYMSLKEYIDKGRPKSDNDNYTIPQQKLENWPLAWRGYIATGTDGETNDNMDHSGNDNQFPKFANTSVKILKLGSGGSLGEAKLGDILLMPKGAASKGKIPALPKVALVTEVNWIAPENHGKSGPPYIVDCAHTKYEKRKESNCYIQVLEADNGKFPDACGTTDNFGEFKTRYYYHTQQLPKVISNAYGKISSTDDCIDSRLQRCRFGPWNEINLYRIKDDVRNGCDKEKAKDCE